jgi:membrane protein YdbS with pleckstrin-like domain
MPDEQVLVRSRPYPDRAIIAWLILGVPTLGIGFLVAGFLWLYYALRKIEWTLTNRRVIQVGGWLTRRVTTVSLDKVQEVNRVSTFLDRKVSRIVRLSLETAATQGTTVIAPLAEDDPLPDALEAAVHQRQVTQPTVG